MHTLNMYTDSAYLCRRTSCGNNIAIVPLGENPVNPNPVNPLLNKNTPLKS